MPTAARVLLVLAAAIALAGAIGAGAATSASRDLTNPKHFFWAPGQSPDGTIADSLGNDLIYHGGNAGSGAIGVEQRPAVYLVYWGPAWASGFQTADVDGKLYSSKTLQTYLDSFFANVGGSPWAGVQTQYCSVALPGATSCVGGAGFVTNPKHQLKGTWTDPTPVPDDIVTLGLAENLFDDPIAAEAQRAAAHFGYDPQATYIVLTPPGPVATGQPVYCGYHTQTTSIDGLGNPDRIQYAFIPWLNTNWPGLGTTGCGMHNVNPTSNAFGNGIFDGWSIVVGHEYSEAVTDPDNFFSVQDGWNDVQGSENADKCAWTNDQNIALGGRQYAIQPMWSNESFDATGNGCVVSR
jgi:serine protease